MHAFVSFEILGNLYATRRSHGQEIIFNQLRLADSLRLARLYLSLLLVALR